MKSATTQFGILGGAGLLVALCLFAGQQGCSKARDTSSSPATPDGIIAANHINNALPPPAALVCAECHQKEYDLWLSSQHAWANRVIDTEQDASAFHPPRRHPIGSFHTEIRDRDGVYQIAQTHTNLGTKVHIPEAVIGIEPLVQYLVPFPGGRLQVVDMSYDPGSNTWFNVFGTQDRQPHEWGYWENRGMNWNVQCAFCHTTNLKKNYNPDTDTYHTTWDAQGVSCAQCHGPMTEHLAAPDAPLTDYAFTTNQIMDNCATCHSRREQMTDNWQPGDNYHDHFRLTAAHQPELYYQDGQVLDEVYVYGSLMMSRMGHAGITCLDCHDPHSHQTVAPVQGNGLCMTCHAPPGRKEASVIDVVNHSHHPLGSTGASCIECHMPLTTYMGNDPRRDHSFSSPDPVLTKELGVPNTCNGCHTEESVDWAIEWTETWYGDKMEQRRSRQRARIIARAQQVDATVIPELLALVQDEEIDYWRATLTELLMPWAGQESVLNHLRAALNDPYPLVRSAAARALAPVPGSAAAINPLRDDPTRMVRIDAVWATIEQNAPDAERYQEVRDYLNFVSDQPSGALRQSQLAQHEGRGDDALAWVRKAAEWDPNGYTQYLLARTLNANGKNAEAVTALLRAIQLEPDNAQYPYALALIYAEAGDPDKALAQLKRTVALDPAFGRAWYNLGLAHAGQDQLKAAVNALLRAERLMPDSPDVPYARATIHLRMNDPAAARQAALRALQLAPGYQPAAALLQQIPGT